MAGLWEPMSAQLVAESVKRMQDQIYSARMKEMDRLEDYYEGGVELRSPQHLIPRPGETEPKNQPAGMDSYRARLDRSACPNVTQQVVNLYRDWTYGCQVERKLGMEAADKLYAEILERNEMPRIQREVGRDLPLFGEACAWVGWVEADAYGPGRVVVARVHPANVMVEYLEDDPHTISRVLERRPVTGDPSCKYVIWIATIGELVKTDPNGAVIERRPNPFGLIPYIVARGESTVTGGSGMSMVGDASYLHRLLLNTLSDMDQLVGYQAGGVGWVKGNQEPELLSGPSNIWSLGHDGEMGFASPAADFAAVLEYLDRLREWAAETASIPVSALKGEQAASGFELVVKYQAAVRAAESLRTEIHSFERRLARVVCAVGAYGHLALPKDPKAEILFVGTMLPADETAAKASDLVEVNNEPPLRKREDYIRAHRPDVKDPKAYVAELDAEAAANRPKPEPAGGGLGGGLAGYIEQRRRDAEQADAEGAGAGAGGQE